jgi:transposase
VIRRAVDRGAGNTTSPRPPSRESSSVTIKPFPDNVADFSDKDIGLKVLAHWFGHHAELKGIDLRQMRNYQNAFEDLRNLTAELEADNISHVLMAQVLRLAAKGNYAGSGHLLKQAISTLGIVAVRDQTVSLYERYIAKQRESSSKASRERAVKAATRQEVWVKIARELRIKHPKWSDSRLATQIAESRDVTVSAGTIRGKLKKLGMSVNSK